MIVLLEETGRMLRLQREEKPWPHGWIATAIWAGLATASLAAPPAYPVLKADSIEVSDVATVERESGDGDQANAAVDSDLGELDALLDADITQLAQTDIIAPVFSEAVTTVARSESTVGRSPAAVYVITNEMLQRSGVRTIPDALRLAPGVNVARIDANKWAISIRGFNDRFSNKLLVQIDGRSVYTPLFAGVFWDVQDVLLEDVDRIEIIRGPGATVWGANAVNGVINIITKSAFDTRGSFVEAGGGNERDFASARIGGQSGNTAWRAYGKWFDRDRGLATDFQAADDWEVGRLGFRTDWKATHCDTVTFQGDYYDGNAGQTEAFPIAGPPFIGQQVDDQEIEGGNVLMRWRRVLDEDSDLSLQAYYDVTDRTLKRDGFGEIRHTFDLDFQHHFKPAQWHSVIWGFGFRNTRDEIDSSFVYQVTPSERSDNRIGTFIQDRMTLMEDLLYFTAGSKFSWNDYTGFEIQPTARLLYTPTNRLTTWAAISRAVRVPSRASDDLRLTLPPINVPALPTYPTIIGNRSIESEELLAFEMGVRSAVSETLFWDVALFYNQYENIETFNQGAPGIDPVTGLFALPWTFFNGASADSYGFELASTWEVDPDWTLRGVYSFLRIDVQPSPLAYPLTSKTEGDNPRNQFALHSSWDLGGNWYADLMGRYVDHLPSQNVPHYFELDARVAYRPHRHLELSVAGRNLLDEAHPEFGNDGIGGALATEVEREVYGTATWRY